MLNKIKLYGLISILTIAGIAHFIIPEKFIVAMPPYIPFHLEMIYLTGVIEIIFAIALFLRKTRYLTSILTALYFLAILPAHIHVAMNNVEMFGISSPLLLWVRTAFQPVIIYWAYSCRNSCIEIEQ